MFQFCYEFQLEGAHAGGEGDIFPVATGIATIRSGTDTAFIVIACVLNLPYTCYVLSCKNYTLIMSVYVCICIMHLRTKILFCMPYV